LFCHRAEQFHKVDLKKVNGKNDHNKLLEMDIILIHDSLADCFLSVSLLYALCELLFARVLARWMNTLILKRNRKLEGLGVIQ
jgi:hypothetical protein